MKLNLSRRMQQLKPSPTLALNAKAKALAEQGHAVINFSVGEPDFPTPEPIVAAAIESLQNGKTKYGVAGGSLPLRKAIAAKLLRDNQLSYQTEEIVVGMGAKEILFHLALALINEGDEVLIPAPYWVSYTEHVLAAGGVPVVIPFPSEHTAPRLTPEMIKPYVTARTVGIVLTSPHNPAGYVLSAEELTTLGAYLRTQDWWIISDEIYEYMTYDVPHLSLGPLYPELHDRFILVNGFSKGYAMTGWRVGYMAGPKAVADLVRTLQTQSSTCIPGFIEDAALKALALGPELMTPHVRELHRRRDIAMELLQSLPQVTVIPPRGAFYLFIDIRKILNDSKRYAKDQSLAFSTKLLENYHVAMVPGEAFGAPGFLRLSYAVDEASLRTGLLRLAEALRTID